MRARTLGIVVLAALLSCTAAFADLVQGSGGWQSWETSILQNPTGTPYWNNTSSDGGLKNVGDCIASVNACAGLVPGAPGVIPYWGLTDGSANTSIYFKQTVPTSNAALKIELAGNAGINQFGWYDTTATTPVLNVIFNGPAGQGASGVFTPTSAYGFWFKGDQGTYYTQTSLGSDSSKQHFAIFQGSTTPGREGYWLGMEDREGSLSDYDYQDMIVQVSAVPDGGMTLMLLGGALFGLETLRRKYRV